MKQENVKVGGIYTTKIGEGLARVEVVHIELPSSWNPRRTRYAVRRIFKDGTIGPVLPKRRTAAALREEHQSNRDPNNRNFTVVVTNLGTLLSTPNEPLAYKTFKEYVKISKSGRGRAGGESVVLFDKDGEIIMEYEGGSSLM